MASASKPTTTHFGIMYFIAEKYDAAEATIRQSLLVTEKLFGQSHPEIGKLYMNLGRSIQAQHRLGEAETLLEKALAIQEKTLEPMNLEIGETLNSLICVYTGLGKHEEAEKVSVRAREIFVKHQQENALSPCARGKQKKQKT